MRFNNVLGPAQFRMLGLVFQLTSEFGRCPRLGEIGRAYGCGKKNVELVLRRLRRAGLVTWEDGCCGTIRPTCRVEVVEAAPARGERKVRRGR